MLFCNKVHYDMKISDEIAPEEVYRRLIFVVFPRNLVLLAHQV